MFQSVKNVLWRGIAYLLTDPRIARWVISHATKEYGHIPGYMNRWQITPNTMPSLIPKRIRTRFKLQDRWDLPFAIRLHEWLRNDIDEDLHDHPWNFRTIILQGWYVEEDAFGKRTWRIEGGTYAALAQTFHTVTHVSTTAGPDHIVTWTLFISFRYQQKWGFMTGSPPRKVYWRDYKSVKQPDGVTATVRKQELDDAG